jgi:hypothetical protein
MPDAVEKEVQGCGKVKETDEVDVLLQYCEEMFGKVVYRTELEAEEYNAKEWSDIELDSGETYVGQKNCEEVAGQVSDMTELKVDMNFDMEWEWNNVELETGEVYVGQKSYGEGMG